jgi:membrane-associated phospholipid phosphatase
MSRLIMKRKLSTSQSLSIPVAECDQVPSKSGVLGLTARRGFLRKACFAAIAANITCATTSAQPAPQINVQGIDDLSSTKGAIPASNRRGKSYRCRIDAAQMARSRPLVLHRSNGDDALYPNKIGSYTKALPHNQLGEVDSAAYATLVRARESQSPDDFERIELGLGRKLTSPQAGLAMDLEGPDSHQVTMPPPPNFASAETAGEMVELYWMSLLRDVNFSEYDTHPLALAASNELSGLADFRGPRQQGKVSPTTLFRSNLAGNLNGPWLSQFLLKDFYFGSNFFSQKIRTRPQDQDFMTNYGDWLEVQNGAEPITPVYDQTPRYIRNLRDLAEWVHVDALYQAYLQACLILLDQGTRLDPGLPLYDAKAQAGFAQCGGPHILSLITEVATRALKAVWYQKWFVHHRLRPEEYGGRVHNHLMKATQYSLHRDILNSLAVQNVFEKYGTYLLPQAFPEGCPTHSSYGSGHATVAGACVTVLKAFFDEGDTIKDPVIPNADGTSLELYKGPPLTVLEELNKVAVNVAFGRNGAGVHWRTDALGGMTLGESVAIGILEEQKLTYNDKVEMTLTRFDGRQVTI